MGRLGIIFVDFEEFQVLGIGISLAGALNHKSTRQTMCL